MIKREMLKVGARFLNVFNEEVEITSIGSLVVVYNHVRYGREFSTNIDYILEKWTPLPQKPKKLGRLYMCVESHREYEDYQELGDIICNGSGVDLNYWKPITIDENGNVFEVINENQ